VTAHEPDESAHEPELENVPEGGPSELKATFPPGWLAVPLSLSDTPAVQVVALPIESALGEQLTEVVEDRLVTVTSFCPELAMCFVSPP
jgi:hypothetical protein